jgi:hypothetical protein
MPFSNDEFIRDLRDYSLKKDSRLKTVYRMLIVSYTLAHSCYMAIGGGMLSSIFPNNSCPEHLLYRSVISMVESSKGPDDKPNAEDRPLFPHPPWMVGIVLVFAVLAILAGLSDPIWLLLGLPCILVLVLFIYVRIVKWNRKGS